MLVATASYADKFDHIDVNTLSVSGTDIFVTARAIQQISQTGNFVEATLKVSGAGNASLELANEAGYVYYGVDVVRGIAPGIYAWVGGGAAEKIGSYAADEEARIMLMLSGSEVRVYKNYAGRNTPALYVAAVPPVFPLIVQCTAASTSSSSGSGTASISKVILTTYPHPKTVYSAAQHTQDGYTPGDSIVVEAYQISKVVGPGQKTRATI